MTFITIAVCVIIFSAKASGSSQMLSDSVIEVRDDNDIKYLYTDIRPSTSTKYFLKVIFNEDYDSECRASFNIMAGNDDFIYHLDFRVKYGAYHKTIVQDSMLHGSWGYTRGETVITDMPDLLESNELTVLISDRVYEVAINGRLIEQQLVSNVKRLDSYAFLQISGVESCLHFDLERSYIQNREKDCNWTYNALESSGSFQSMNYPDLYPDDSNCVTLIEAAPDHVIRVTFETIDIEYHDTCLYDYIEVRDGNVPTAPLLGKFCGELSTKIFTSSSSYLWIKFRSDASVSKTGYFAHFVAFEASTFEIIDSNGKPSSSGLLIIHNPHISRNSDSPGTVCNSGESQKMGDLICTNLGYECMAHIWSPQYLEEISNIQTSYLAARTQLHCPNDAIDINQCEQISDESDDCKSHRNDIFIKCETSDFDKVNNVECSIKDCNRIKLTADEYPTSGLNSGNLDEITQNFEFDAIVDHIDVIVNDVLYKSLVKQELSLDIMILQTIDLDYHSDSERLTGSKCTLDLQKDSRFPHFIDCQAKRYAYLRYNCYATTEAAAIQIIPYIVWDAEFLRHTAEIFEIEVYGKPLIKTGQAGDQFVTHNTLTPPIAATEAPRETSEDQLDFLQNSVPADIQNANEDNYEVVWAPTFKGSISYEVLMSAPTVDTSSTHEMAKSSVLGFLANRGYLDYVLSEEKDVSDKRTKVKVDNIDVTKSIKLFQKFNGFPETGEVSKDTIDYVEKPRCGVSDIEYSRSMSDEEKELCFSAIVDKKIMDKEADNDCKGLTFGNHRQASVMDICDLIPTFKYNSFIETGRSYFIQADITFKPYGGLTWESLANNFAIWYNFDDSIGETGFGDLIQLYATNSEFGFQYQILTEGAPVMKRLSNYTLSRVQLARREFKIRIDVEEGGVSYLLINGHDIGMLQYSYPMRSAAVLQYRFGIPEIVTARLCKRPDETTIQHRRRRSQSASLHKWGSNTITYNFQNYSSHLGEEGTRMAIVQSLFVISQSSQLNFVEKARHEVTMLAYMFIKGKHADGMTFHGAGQEKAHAYTPVHSEIHFNDWEKFTLEKEDQATSIFYVALHETGHALGLRHSDYADAVMASGYKENAFGISDLHRVDKATLKTQYPGEGTGNVEELSVTERLSTLNVPYQPRYPLPRECISQIDAGFLLGSKIYLISNTLVWQYSAAGIAKLGPPKRLSDVFAGWAYTTRAAFTVGSKLFLVSDSVVRVYKQFGSVFIIDEISSPNKILNSKSSNYVFPPIKSAFTITDQIGAYTTTLVTGEREYFQLSWNKKKSVKHVQKVIDREGLSLIGKTFGTREFNAAIPYMRKKKSGEAMELYKFDRKFVKSVQIYPQPQDFRSNDPFQEVSKAFNIESWCPPNLKN